MRRPYLIAALALGLCSCEGAVDFRVTYDPMRFTVTIVGRAEGSSRSKTIAIENLTLDADGCAFIEDPDCGTVKICGAAGGNVDRIEIVCNDPLLFQVPEDWVAQSGSWAQDSGESGMIALDDGLGYRPPADIAMVVEPGMRPVVAIADEVFPDGFVGELRAEFDTAGQNPVGGELRGFEVMVASYFDADGIEVAPREIVVPFGSGDLDFASDAAVAVPIELDPDAGGSGGVDESGGEPGGSSGTATGTNAASSGGGAGSGAAADGGNSNTAGGCGCTSGGPDSPLPLGLAIFGPLLGLGVLRRRRR